jgi:hypothetical protein
MRCKVGLAEADAVSACVVVYSEVYESLLTTKHDATVDELAAQVTVAAHTRDVIDTVFGRHVVPHEKANSVPVSCNRGSEHGSVFVSIARKEMCEELRLDLRRNIDAAADYTPG